jgi:hypothetical protein
VSSLPGFSDALARITTGVQAAAYGAATLAAATAAGATREAFALATPPHGPTSADCAGCYARCDTPESHWFGCTCARHGTDAARQVAKDIAAHTHAHLIAEGETVCLRGGCPTHPVLDGVR